MAVFFIVCDLLPSSDYSVKHILKVAISAAIGGAVSGIIFGGIFKFNRPVQNKNQNKNPFLALCFSLFLCVKLSNH